MILALVVTFASKMIFVRALPTRHRKQSCTTTVFAFHGDMVQSACPLEFPHRHVPACCLETRAVVQAASCDLFGLDATPATAGS